MPSPGRKAEVRSFEEYLRVMRPRLWLASLRQAVRLPRTLWSIYRLVREDCSALALDGNVRSFRAHEQGLPDPHGHARRWDKARLADVAAKDVLGMSVWELALMMSVAMEIEEPIFEYSRQNAEAFRSLAPALAGFMGDAHDDSAPRCDSPWCSEERRHANTFARMIERLTATSPKRDNPNQPMPVASNARDARLLLGSRESAEWNSSSTYLVMAAHATRHLHTLIRNIARDEIKHLSVLSYFDVRLFGSGPWKRFFRLVRRGLQEYGNHRRKRSAGHLLGTNPITSFEVVVCHLLVEYRVRRWLRAA